MLSPEFLNRSAGMQDLLVAGMFTILVVLIIGLFVLGVVPPWF
jgi:hypothetical protein